MAGMKTVAFDMDVPRQLRKLDALVTYPSHVSYVGHLKDLLLASVAAGTPQPASQFVPMFQEEFDVV
jgi:hypothetical protein